MKTQRKAQLKISFIIVGGGDLISLASCETRFLIAFCKGLSGLSAAYTLAQAGHFVRVLEQRPTSNEWTGGIQVPPNLTRILFEWGLEQELKDTSLVNRTDIYDSELWLYRAPSRQLTANSDNREDNWLFTMGGGGTGGERCTVLHYASTSLPHHLTP